LEGSEDSAKVVVAQALAAEYSAAEVGELILAHAQGALGKLWHKGSISIAEEHRATQVTLQTLGYVSSAAKAGNKVGKKMLVTSLQGDRHLVGVRIVADMFRLDGWDVDSLGSDLPADEIVESKETSV
jgi:methanogenic corrinoid protein MtbC1